MTCPRRRRRGTERKNTPGQVDAVRPIEHACQLMAHGVLEVDRDPEFRFLEEARFVAGDATRLEFDHVRYDLGGNFRSSHPVGTIAVVL